jgi:Cys-tRNA(Pro)/Cys-tRNA(Cys) deacylase
MPGNRALVLRSLAKMTGDKKIEMVLLKELEPLTVYIPGGVTARSCKKPDPVDETAELFDVISTWAETRGLQTPHIADELIRRYSAESSPSPRARSERGLETDEAQAK